VRNMDLVMSRFAHSIDTIKGDNIRKTVLLATSDHSRTLTAPVEISLESVQQQPNPRDYRLRHVPAAVLLEGKFTSLYNHRIATEERNALKAATGKDFKA